MWARVIHTICVIITTCATLMANAEHIVRYALSLQALNRIHVRSHKKNLNECVQVDHQMKSSFLWIETGDSFLLLLEHTTRYLLWAVLRCWILKRRQQKRVRVSINFFTDTITFFMQIYAHFFTTNATSAIHQNCLILDRRSRCEILYSYVSRKLPPFPLEVPE